MRPSSARPICRSPNSFSPSIALWQHFILLNRPFFSPKRLSSTTESQKSRSTEDTCSPPPGPSERSETESIGRHEGPKFKIRRVRDIESGNKSSTSLPASVETNGQALLPAAKCINDARDQLLNATKAAFHQNQDYEGVVVKPKQSVIRAGQGRLPWGLNLEKKTATAHERLNIEIARFFEYAKPNPTEILARRHLIEQVRFHVRKVLPEHILEVFGSERTGIALATSDIDLRLMRRNDPIHFKGTGLPPSRQERAQLLKDLHYLYYREIKKHKAFIHPLLRHARYPLIALQDQKSGLDVQIVLSNDTSVSRKIMQRYMQEYPYLLQLYSVIKTIFDSRGLSDVFKGGFGSYSIFMMIVASIQQNPSPRKDAAGALTNFLSFWKDFDTVTKGISIEPMQLFDKSTESVLSKTTQERIQQGTAKPLPKYMLSLRDPADETNDLGRKGIVIKHVQKTFDALSQQLDLSLKQNTRHSLLAPLVGDIYALNRSRRKQLAGQGRYVRNRVKSSFAKKAKHVRENEEEKNELR